VCIIGAGPRGLVSARHLSEVKNLEVVIFESKSDVGGVWLFQNEDESTYRSNNYNNLYNCDQNSIYQTLLTNLPYFFMELKDFPMREFKSEIPNFITIDLYQKYLSAYTDRFNLRKLIQFNTLVKSVRLYENLDEDEKTKVKNPRKFVVTTVDSTGTYLNENQKVYDFDYIIIASGQYSAPYIPNIPGIENFKGNSLHCKYYRTPHSEIFNNKRVLIIGGGASATDLLVQLFTGNGEKPDYCKKVIVSARSLNLKEATDFKNYVEIGRLDFKPVVTSFKEHNIACFKDGTEEEIDTIIYSTGYKFKFPYLDLEKDKIIDYDENQNRGGFFGPIYKKFIAIREPNMFFIGFLQMTTIVHILPELQALTAKFIIEGKLPIPSKEDMMKSFEEDVQKHLTGVGDLAHFFKTNLIRFFPDMSNSIEDNEWIFFSNWLKTVYPNNNEEKSKEFFDLISATKRKLRSYTFNGNWIEVRKIILDDVFPRDYKNTTEFV